MERPKFSKLHFAELLICILGFIFLLVGLLSTNWLSVSKCWTYQGATKTEYTVDYSHGLFAKCVGGECSNIMDTPPEVVPQDSDCTSGGTTLPNNWYHASDCKEGKKCVNGKLEKKVTCGNSEYFDLKSHKCTSSRPSCGTCHEWQCRGKSSNSRWILKDLLCQTYYKCESDSSGIKRYQEKTVASGEWYDDINQKTVSVKPGKCWDADCVRNGNPHNDVVVTDGDVCEKYYKCNNGFKTTKTCNAGETVGVTGSWVDRCITVANYQVQSADDRKVCQNPKCKASPNTGDYTGASGECSSYYQCSSSKKLTLGSCSASEYFTKDSTIGSCKTTQPAGCKHYKCRSRGDGYQRTDGTNCKAWDRCYDSGKNYETGSCPTGTLVNPATLAPTVTSDSTRCTTAQKPLCKDPRCSGKPEGFLATKATTDDKTCRSYFKCGAGEEIRLDPDQTCPGKQVFFPPSLGKCVSETTSGSTSCFDPRCTKLDATHSTTKYEYDNPNEVAPRRIDCRQYYKCTNGFYTEQSCSSSSDYFDKSTGKCTSTRPSTCRDYKCYNRANGKWRTSDTGCSSYYECLNGLVVSGSTGSTCPSGQSLQNGLSTNVFLAGTCVDHTATNVPGCGPGVDGGWGSWSLWSACQRNTTKYPDGRAGISYRTRQCDCPARSGTGKACSGDDVNIQMCYTCSPEIASFSSGRQGMIIALTMSILCLSWAIRFYQHRDCNDAHTIIWHSLVASLAGIIGAAIFMGGKPELDCEVETGAGFILSIIGAVFHIIAIVVAVVICCKTAKASAVGINKMGKCNNEQEMKAKDEKAESHSATNPAAEA